MRIPPYILPVIVLSQFCCTSLWFAGNGVMSDLVAHFALQANALGHLTSMVQFGFISGTLMFALLMISDRFHPSKIFFTCALLGAAANASIIFNGNTLGTLLVLRFLTGFFLAGIYPVGMKIAADYYTGKLGRSLGYLVGALVLGTAFPHFLKGASVGFPWQYVLVTTSILAVIGGSMMVAFVPDGPYRSYGQRLDLTAFFRVFKDRDFRAAAFGYFGHMWELYAFWAFVPVILITYNAAQNSTIPISYGAFAIISAGSIGCVLGSTWSLRKGSRTIASAALFISGICCLLSPWFFTLSNPWVFMMLMIIWGAAVVADSPLFSTLVAQNCDSQVKGTALTIVNGIGFSITILSIELLNRLNQSWDPRYIYLTLAVGPIIGLLAFLRRREVT